MNGISKRFARPLALLLVIILFVTLIPFTIYKHDTKAAEVDEISAADRKIAADISNMTGASTEEILQLKKQCGSWNDVLDKLKITGESPDDNDHERLQPNIPDSAEPESQLIKSGTPQLPELPVQNVKPRNPAEEVMDEIRQISPVKDMR